MALDFDSSHPYSVVVRLGDILGGINEANTFASSTAATRANTISDDYLTISRQGEVITDLYTQAKNVASDLGDWSNYFAGLLTATIQTMCRDDTTRPRTDDLDGWFNKINRDMTAGAYNWTLPTVTGTVAVPGTNIGTGYLISSTVEPVDGLATYYAYSEVVRLECTTDSYAGGATAGNESFNVYGETSVEKTDQVWPKGSGANSSLTAVSMATDAITTDGGLEAWTLVSGSNYRPTDWTLFGSTTAGTHINREATAANVYDGTYSAKFMGDGATVVGISQALSLSTIVSNTNYAISFWFLTPASSNLSTANLRVALVDGNNAVITDNAGNAQSSTLNAAALNASNGTWTLYKTVLRTPRNLPTALSLEFRFPSGNVLDATSSTKIVYLDHITVSAMSQLYSGGPYLAVHAGAISFAQLDAFTDTIANNKTTTSFVRNFDRFFNLADNDIRLVVTGSTQISDSLIA